MAFDNLPPFLPVNFFEISANIKPVTNFSFEALTKRHRLGSTAKLLDEEAFAEIHLGWHKKGLVIHIEVEEPFTDCFFPAYAKGDSVELFFNTRDNKQSSITRFCHHFVFLPKKYEGVQKQEVTHLRLEDSRPLANSEDITLDIDFKRKSYSMKILLPTVAIYGYDTDEYKRLGFHYRINRANKDAQHFAFSSKEFKHAMHPNIWATLHLGE